MKIIEYCLVTDNFSEGMRRQVEAFLKKDFQPLGGVAIGYASGADGEQVVVRFAQAMVKYQSKLDEDIEAMDEMVKGAING